MDVIIRSTDFGDRYDFDMPEGCDVIIVGSHSNSGIKPLSICLPHQVYVSKVAKIRIEVGGDVYLIPASSKNYIVI